jgi:uncharacterized protein (TIGR03067 family)
MLRWTTALLFVVPLVAAFAPAPKPKDDPKSELKKLQGTWKVVDIDRTEGGGKSLLRKAPEKAVVAGDQWTYHRAGGRTLTPVTVALDPTTRPKSFTFTQGDRVVFRGIYSTEGDTLKISYIRGIKKERPKDFAATAKDQITITFRRQQP